MEQNTTVVIQRAHSKLGISSFCTERSLVESEEFVPQFPTYFESSYIVSNQIHKKEKCFRQYQVEQMNAVLFSLVRVLNEKKKLYICA